MTTTTLEKCGICGKMCKSVKRHKEASHRELTADEINAVKVNLDNAPAYSTMQPDFSIQEGIDRGIAQLQADAKPHENPPAYPVKPITTGLTVETIARIIFDDVARSICDSNGISLGEWDNIDQNDYLKVARKIKG